MPRFIAIIHEHDGPCYPTIEADDKQSAEDLARELDGTFVDILEPAELRHLADYSENQKPDYIAN
jgi:hypothetical protein